MAQYTPKTWTTGETITAARLNAIEGAAAAAVPKADADAAYVTVLLYTGGAYPARPSSLPGGMVKYVGPTQPTTWLSGDEWVNNS